MKKNLIKITCFVLLGVIVIAVLNYFYQPIWKNWNNYSTIYGFYEEPQNTIETIFLGSSVTVNGIAPMELYENNGICAYNLGTEQQPLLASYYWLLEANRLHNETLKTVVLDTSMLRRTPDRAYYQKALDGMQMSNVKIKALKDYTENINEYLNYMCPVLEYHDRWSSIEMSDFEKKKYNPAYWVRGYNFKMDRVLDLCEYNQIVTPDYYIMSEAGSAELNEESLYYLNEMVSFCKNNNLKLVLMKTPAVGAWNVQNHNAVAELAEKNQLEFYDFNYEPYISAINYNESMDNEDGVHLNYYGARKLTKWFGRYLLEYCQNEDVRGNSKYDYMESELTKYKKYISSVTNLKESTDVVEYISNALENSGNVIFLTAKEEASGGLQDWQRQKLKEMGLEKLSEIGHADSYLGIIDYGNIMYERLDSTEYNPEERRPEILISYDIDKTTIANLKSGGFFFGNVSSCVIDGEEYSKNLRGINIIVYNKEEKKVLDSRTFDTCVNLQEPSWNLEAELESELSRGTEIEQWPADVKKLYLYNERCEESRKQ